MSEIQQDNLSNFIADDTTPVESVSNDVSKTEETWEQKSLKLEKELGASQRMIGEQGRQIGEYRSLVEKMSSTAVAPVQSELKDEDFISDPKASTEKMLDERLSAYEEKITQLENQAVTSSFETRHPEARNLLKDQNFVDWANQNHAYLANKTSAGDMEAADSLFDAWDKKAPEVEADNKTALRAASTERPQAAPAPSTGGKAPISREKYRQALQRGETIPASVMNELMEAYASGNIKD